MQNLNKKGVSDLISNVLIILLVVTLIGTISSQIFQLVKSPTLSPEKNCPLLISKNILQVQNICFNELSQETEITLRRNTGNIILEELSFNLGGEIYSCGNSCGSCQILQEKELKTYYFNENKQEASIFLNGCLIEKKKVMKC